MSCNKRIVALEALYQLRHEYEATIPFDNIVMQSQRIVEKPHNMKQWSGVERARVVNTQACLLPAAGSTDGGNGYVMLTRIPSRPHHAKALLHAMLQLQNQVV